MANLVRSTLECFAMQQNFLTIGRLSVTEACTNRYAEEWWMAELSDSGLLVYHSHTRECVSK